MRTRAGFLKKAHLKIPWNNLAGSPVSLIIDGLLILCVPSHDVKVGSGVKRVWAKWREPNSVQ